ncbi:alpha/beta hydrolase family protein [Reichenbachiella sp.]|uniref:alpha/beta hydrolase family protein n=1 Tax=Reichenbachiella sp. TaxID=2184521 RepID=UPI003B597971
MHCTYKSQKSQCTFRWLVFLLIISSCDSGDDVISGEGVFITQIENASIEGQLFLPEGNGPFPVLIAVEGSGNESRESTAPFAPIFNSFGYGLYIYDKRGLGGSTGSYPLETIENPFDFLTARAEDVQSIVKLLKKHMDLKSDRIGLFAASQGTWVSTIVHEQMASDISMMLFVSGGAASTGEENYYESLIAEGLSITEANQSIYQYEGTIGYDPKPVLADMKIETLFIFGEKDTSHPTLYDEEIVMAMDKSNFTIYSFENADHSLLDANTRDFPEELFPIINDWLTLQNE